jgi:hypothetical protein
MRERKKYSSWKACDEALVLRKSWMEEGKTRSGSRKLRGDSKKKGGGTEIMSGERDKARPGEVRQGQARYLTAR